MKISITKIAYVAGILLALAFAFSCSGDPEPSPSPPNEPSSASTGNEVKLCGGVEYDASIYRCESGELIGKCKGADFYVAYQVCNNGVIEDKEPAFSSSVTVHGSSSSVSVPSSNSAVSSSSSIALPSSSSVVSSSSSAAVPSSSSTPSSSSPSVSSSSSVPSSSSTIVPSSSSTPSSSSSSSYNGVSSSSSSHTPVWGAWVQTTAPTCEAPGLETRTNDISETETRQVAQLVWSNWSVTTSATCAATGVETRYCPFNASPAQTQTIAQVTYNNATQTCEGGIVKTRFTDMRDNIVYKSVVIGTQTWMAENLNYNTNTSGSKCYKNATSNCTSYGRLYNRATAKTVCPSGWHLPSDAEWTTLTNFVGTKAGTKLKAKSGWESYAPTEAGTGVWAINGNGTDDYGFAAKPGGRGLGPEYGGGNEFEYLGIRGNWWSATLGDAGSPYYYYRYIYNNNEGFGRDFYNESHFLSVRCVQD